MLSERGSDADRSTKCVGALRRAVKLPCRNLCLPASAASPATATTSARCPHRDLYPAVSQATAMVLAKTMANHSSRTIPSTSWHRRYEADDAVALVPVFRRDCYPQNQTEYITYRFSTGEPWDPGTVAEHLGESTTFQRFSCSCITGNTTEPFKSHVPAVTSKAWSKGLSSGWTREGHSCSRQPLPNPSSSHATTKAGSSPERKSLQPTPAPRPGDIFTSLCDVTSEGVAVCMCSTGYNVANVVRSNGDRENGPCAIYEGERFLFLGVAISDPHCSTR